MINFRVDLLNVNLLTAQFFTPKLNGINLTLKNLKKICVSINSDFSNAIQLSF